MLITYCFLNKMTHGVLKPDHPSNRESVRPTVHPFLLGRKSNIVLKATTSTLFEATTKGIMKEVARPTAALPLLWWRTKVATFVVALK